jgi:hypothetical protein
MCVLTALRDISQALPPLFAPHALQELFRPTPVIQATALRMDASFVLRESIRQQALQTAHHATLVHTIQPQGAQFVCHALQVTTVLPIELHAMLAMLGTLGAQPGQ